ncbi:hypothetical protein PoB_000733200 [Plakobranchus ocellatus]|uniref:Secreted protein n=1 Tax=Plakobranchus ocellatus TaxID=259542 RepID=A0AAV3YF92_9GAST|nr:hypothetical protein PoB_000733200 [Plakobranchus ocellatus]
MVALAWRWTGSKSCHCLLIFVKLHVATIATNGQMISVASLGFSVNEKTARPQQDDLRLSGPPSGRGAGGWARSTHDRRIHAVLRADSQATVPSTLRYSGTIHIH